MTTSTINLQQQDTAIWEDYVESQGNQLEGRQYLFSQMGTPASFSWIYAGRFKLSSGSAGSFTWNSPQRQIGKKRTLLHEPSSYRIVVQLYLRQEVVVLDHTVQLHEA